MAGRFGTIALVGLALGTSAVAFVVGYVRTSEPSYAESRELPGLREPVVIGWDSLAVPHIHASAVEDLLFAQGYLHAQDRLWQLELFRRVAEGRLSEIFGDELLESDRFLRTLGIWRSTERAAAEVDPRSRALLAAYAAGINVYLETRTGALPPEFLVLRIEPEPWTIRHSLAIEKLMSWDLSPYYLTQNLASAVARIGPERARFLTPAYPDWGTTILEADTAVGAEATLPRNGGAAAPEEVGSTAAGMEALAALGSIPVPPAVPPHAAALLEAASIRRASNAWVIAGDRTRSGRPILANDMHLPLRAPGIWYLAALHGAGFHVAGMTLPGAPFVIAGHNRAVAWGFTNAMVDDLDVYVERVDPTDSTRYLTPDGSLPFDVVRETIRVKDRDEDVELIVRSTRNGVVISDVADDLTSTIAGGPVQPGAADDRDLETVLSLRWAGHEPSASFRAFPAMNRARSAAEFRDALRWFQNPHQNVVFADTTGVIGYQMAGRVPVRGTGRPAPSLPVPGWTGDWDWTGRRPFEEHPALADTAAGYVVTANNRQTAAASAAAITASWEPPFRAARITQMIEGADRADADAVHRMQMDVTDLHAARYVDRAIQAARNADLGDVAADLEGWDRRAGQGSRAAPYYYVWYGELGQILARDLHGGEGWMPRAAIDAVLEARAVPWRDDSAAAFRELAAGAMQRAAQTVADRTWGELHSVRIGHALSSSRLLDRLLDLGLGPVARGGSPTTVNVSHYLPGPFPVVSGYGASQRHVVDLADPDGAGGFVLPGGQTGIPTSPHYRDQFDRWLNGGLWRIPLDQTAAQERHVNTMRLRAE